MQLPDVYFGKPEKEYDVPEDNTPDNDEELPETDPSVVAILGFDPLDLDSGTAQDANLIESNPNDTLPEILRNAIAAEIDAINLYEKMAANTTDSKVAKILLSVAQEEKVHVGEFQELLLEIDPDQLQALVDGARETEGGQP